MKNKLTNLRNLFLVLVIGTTVISSCSKDDKTDDIVGNWTSGLATYTATVGTRTLAQYLTDVMGLTADQSLLYSALLSQSIQQAFTGTLQLKSDNTFTSNLGGTADSGTWSLSSDRTKLTINSASDGPMTYDVVELTSSKLKLHAAEVVSEDLNEDGTDELINVDLSVSFTK